jgi:hypothetical protein
MAARRLCVGHPEHPKIGRTACPGLIARFIENSSTGPRLASSPLLSRRAVPNEQIANLAVAQGGSGPCQRSKGLVGNRSGAAADLISTILSSTT